MDRFLDMLFEMLRVLLDSIFSTKGRERERSQPPPGTKEPGSNKPEKPTAEQERNQAYELLGLEPGAPQNEVRAMYRVLAMKWHPDRNIGNEEAAAMMQVQSTVSPTAEIR